MKNNLRLLSYHLLSNLSLRHYKRLCSNMTSHKLISYNVLQKCSITTFVIGLDIQFTTRYNCYPYTDLKQCLVNHPQKMVQRDENSLKWFIETVVTKYHSSYSNKLACNVLMNFYLNWSRGCTYPHFDEIFQIKKDNNYFQNSPIKLPWQSTCTIFHICIRKQESMRGLNESFFFLAYVFFFFFFLLVMFILHCFRFKCP